MAGKADIVNYVMSEVEGVTRKQATEVVESAISGMTHFLTSGDRVQLPSFGSFSVALRAARQGRNPKTGETIPIPESRNVKFKAGKELKEALNS